MSIKLTHIIVYDHTTRKFHPEERKTKACIKLHVLKSLRESVVWKIICNIFGFVLLENNSSHISPLPCRPGEVD